MSPCSYALPCMLPSSTIPTEPVSRLVVDSAARCPPAPARNTYIIERRLPGDRPAARRLSRRDQKLVALACAGPRKWLGTTQFPASMVRSRCLPRRCNSWIAVDKEPFAVRHSDPRIPKGNFRRGNVWAVVRARLELAQACENVGVSVFLCYPVSFSLR